MSTGGNTVFAATRFSESPSKITCSLSYERVALLLRPDINEADRLALNFALANSMVHEIMHAFGFAKRHRQQLRQFGIDSLPSILEPYFMDEQVAELGFSTENAVRFPDSV